MLANTGTVSFILYGIFIFIALLGLFLAIYTINKGTITGDKLDKIIDLAKYTIVSVAIATVTLIVTNLFKEREQDVKELEYFDKYVQDVKKADGIQERYQLSRYLAIVAPVGDLKKSWQEYFDTTKIEYQIYLIDKKEQKRLDTISHPTKEQEIKKSELDEKIEAQDAPFVSIYGNNLTPRVYIQINDESQRQTAKLLQAVLRSAHFLAPGVTYTSGKGNAYFPSQIEVRYYREEELQDALRLITILKNQKTGLPLNDVPQKVPGTGRGTRPGHFEIWFAKLR